MIRFFLTFIIILYSSNTYASISEKIINKLNEINNLEFSFIQTVDEKEEKGNCIISYPKKIYCKYDSKYNKILVSNGRSLVIKSKKNNHYFRYPLKNTPLFFLLDKDFLIKKIITSNSKLIDNKYYMISIKESNQLINIFFNKSNLQLVGWQTEDIYQNLSVTYIFDIKKNKKVNYNLFKLPQ